MSKVLVLLLGLSFAIPVTAHDEPLKKRVYKTLETTAWAALAVSPFIAVWYYFPTWLSVPTTFIGGVALVYWLKKDSKDKARRAAHRRCVLEKWQKENQQ